MIQLVTPSSRYKSSFIEAMLEFKVQGDGRLSDVAVNISEAEGDFPAFIQKLLDEERGVGLSEGQAPVTHLWLVEGETFLGSVSVRHRLNAKLSQEGGHIGYSIRPSKRRLGYGTRALELVLPVAKRLGIEQVLVVCHNANMASQKIIEKNGGTLEDVREVHGVVKRRYRIQ